MKKALFLFFFTLLLACNGSDTGFALSLDYKPGRDDVRPEYLGKSAQLRALGTYFHKDTVLATHYSIDGKTGLLVLRLGKGKELPRLDFENSAASTVGQAAIINQELYDCKVYDNPLSENTSAITLQNDRPILKTMETDSVKSFRSNFSKLAIKFGTDAKKKIVLESHNGKTYRAELHFINENGENYLMVLAGQE